MPLRHRKLTVPPPKWPPLQVYGLQEENWEKAALSIVVVGASGDLAKKKIFPSLFALYYENMLPQVRPCSALPAGMRAATPARLDSSMAVLPGHLELAN